MILGPPVAIRARQLAPDKLKTTKREFDAMGKLGISRPSSSSWASPLHMVPKSNDEWCPCGDYRGLNDRTISDKYPVRHIHDFSQSLRGKKIVSKIDLAKASSLCHLACLNFRIWILASWMWLKAFKVLLTKIRIAWIRNLPTSTWTIGSSQAKLKKNI